MKTTPRYNGASAVAKSLQRYADRGVFRGLSTSEAKNGRREFRFLWLTCEPMHVTYDPVGSSLTFTHLFPNAVSVLGMAAGLKGALRDNGCLPDIRTAVGSKQGALTGSIWSQVPVVLVEMCVLSNAKDEAFLLSEVGQERMAKALAAGVEAALA